MLLGGRVRAVPARDQGARSGGGRAERREPTARKSARIRVQVSVVFHKNHRPTRRFSAEGAEISNSGEASGKGQFQNPTYPLLNLGIVLWEKSFLSTSSHKPLLGDGKFTTTASSGNKCVNSQEMTGLITFVGS